MMLRRVVIVSIVALAALPSPAQEDEERPVREQMRRVFAARLKADVGLDDAQIAVVLPRIQALERERAEATRRRRTLVRELRGGLAAGMPDPELQRRLDDLDRIGQETERATRAALEDLDETLTVPQRVRLRFLLVRFRDEMTRRVEDFARGAGRQRRAP
jgi:hypothetical protein